MAEAARLMSVTVQLAGKKELLSAINSASITEPLAIATLNPEFMVEAENNSEFRESLESMTLCSIDGSGLYFATKLLYALKKLKEKPELYHGSDLIEDLFRLYADGSKRFYFLGGPEGLGEAVATALRHRYPNLNIVGTASGGLLSRAVHPEEISPAVIADIQKAQPDILLLNLGVPKQELWMMRTRGFLTVPVCIGIGGSLEFYVNKPRAPRLFRALHLEWLFRSFVEAGHWRRALNATIVFPLHFFGWLFTGKA